MQADDELPTALTERSMQVSRQAIRAYAQITQDFNPIHLDPDFAARSPMGGVIAHGTLSLGLIWQALQMSLGTERMRGVTLDVRFMRPVREDDTVVAGGILTDDRSGYDVRARTQDGTVVIGGIALLASPVVT